MLMQRRPEPQKSWEFPASRMQGFCGAFKIHRRQGSALQLEHSCCPSAWTKLLLREDQVLWLLLLIVESRRDPRAADDEAEAWCAKSPNALQAVQRDASRLQALWERSSSLRSVVAQVALRLSETL